VNIVGHRGASGAELENTQRAFSVADEMGADGVELDVRIASDGRGGQRLVVFHNPLPHDQVAIDALPSFDEILDACGERMLINVEIKNSDDEGGHDPTMAVVPPTIAAMHRRGPNWANRWLISSFSRSTVDHCRLVGPGFPTALLVYAATDEAIAHLANGGHSAIHPAVEGLDAERVEACHRAGLAVNAWTCNDPQRIAELAAIGIDGVCTDVPDIALEALRRSASDPDLTPMWGRPA